MTELIWEGKYDAQGRRVPPVRVALPFQTVETVNESAQERQRSLDLFGSGRDSEWRNRLIWGDKKYVLPALLKEFGGQVNLIYIDPPFKKGQDFSFATRVEEAELVHQPSMIEMKAYRDTWGRDLDSYLEWFYGMAVGLCDLLALDGNLYVHLDYDIVHYVKALLDEVFGIAQFQSEIIWKRTSARSASKAFNHIHDTILHYSKSSDFVHNRQFVELSEEYKSSHYGSVEAETGRRYTLDNLTGSGTTKGPSGQPWRGFAPAARGRHWGMTPDRLDQLDHDGRIYWPPNNGFPRYKRYLDEMPGRALQSVWADISPVNSQATERVGYDTQKPEALLERIVKASSNENDLVLDVVVGSGTTAVVAENLGRRWIAADLGRFAISTTRKRLLSIPSVRPFVVQNLGKYERQAWQVAEFGEGAGAQQLAYRRFILDLYRATALDEGYVWLHGLKEGRMVHVGSVDAPVSTGDVTQIALELKKAIGSGAGAPTTKRVDVLGWDFAFELNEVAKQQAAAANIDLRFVRIPREVLDKRAVEQGDIRFFELAALSVDAVTKGRSLGLTLSDFVIPLDDVPEDVQRAITNWSQWIDYWAVDWDNKGDTFHNEWQAYRTRQKRDLEKSATHTYEQGGTYRVVIKVIDILGNDTTKTLSVEVG